MADLLGKGGVELLKETRRLQIAAVLDPLLAEPTAVVPLDEFGPRARCGRFSSALPSHDMRAALEAAEQDGFIQVRNGGVQLSSAAQDGVAAIRTSVETAYRDRFGKPTGRGGG